MVASFFTNPDRTIELHLLQRAYDEEEQRLRRYRKAWDYYYGRHPRPLKIKKDQPDDNVISNKARSVVDKGVAFLFGQDITFQLDKGTNSAREQWLERCWRSNKKMTLLQKLATNGAVCGTPFVKIIEPAGAGLYPRLVVLDPATVSVRWSMDDYDDVVAYRIQWEAIDPRTAKPKNLRQIIERASPLSWTIIDQESQPDSTTWETVTTRTWDHEWPPIAHCQNLPAPNDFWGIADLEDDVLQLNASRNFLLSNMQRIIRYHAHPKTWGKGFRKEQMEIGPDESLVLESKDAEVHNLEMTGDLAASLDYDKRLDEALHELARIPPIATGKVENIGPLSGTAMQILYQPLLEITQLKRETYGEMIATLSKRMLELGNIEGAAVADPTIVWFELLPTDPLQERQVAIADHQLGASSETLLKKLGYDPQAEARQRAKEDAVAVALAQTALPKQVTPPRLPTSGVPTLTTNQTAPRQE